MLISDRLHVLSLGIMQNIGADADGLGNLIYLKLSQSALQAKRAWRSWSKGIKRTLHGSIRMIIQHAAASAYIQT